MIKVICVQKLKFDSFYVMILSEDSAEKPKKKRGRPKGTKNKTETKKPKTKATEKKEPTPVSVSKAEKAAALAEKAANAAAKAEEAKLKAEAEAEAEYQTAVKLATTPEAGEVLSNKRNQERIFRREMGEPEFFRSKKELTPPIPILSDAEGKAISRKVQIPINNLPQYAPEHILSPEYAGLSNYELGISTVQEETEEKLAALRNDPNANPMSIEKAEEDLQLIENMVNNYSLTANVFRTAKGGRDKLKK